MTEQSMNLSLSSEASIQLSNSYKAEDNRNSKLDWDWPITLPSNSLFESLKPEPNLLYSECVKTEGCKKGIKQVDKECRESYKMMQDFWDILMPYLTLFCPFKQPTLCQTRRETKKRFLFEANLN